MDYDFRREEFYGLNFLWFAIDSIGSLGAFWSGYGPIPKQVFSDKSVYDELTNLIENLPIMSEPQIKDYLLSENKSVKELFDWYDLALVKRGLYIFDSRDVSNDYDLYLKPKTPLNVENLSDRMQQFLKPLTFKSVSFSELNYLNVTDYFECD